MPISGACCETGHILVVLLGCTYLVQGPMYSAYICMYALMCVTYMYIPTQTFCTLVGVLYRGKFRGVIIMQIS